MFNPIKHPARVKNGFAPLWVKQAAAKEPAVTSGNKTVVTNTVEKNCYASIPFNTHLKTNGEKLLITVKGARYEIKTSGFPVSTSLLMLKGGQIVRLLKKQ